MYGKILIVTQGNGTDEALVAHIAELARGIRADVTLLRIIAVANDEAGGLGIQFQTEIGSSGWRRMNQAKQLLPQLERRLREKGVCVETALVIGTRPEADEIVSYAARNDFDLIAMMSDSQPWYKRLIGRSTADGVLRKATVPTLLIGDGMKETPVERTTPEGNKVMEVFGSVHL